MEKCTYLVQVPRPTIINHYFSFLPIEHHENSGVAIQNPVHLSLKEENSEYLEFSHL